MLQADSLVETPVRAVRQWSDAIDWSALWLKLGEAALGVLGAVFVWWLGFWALRIILRRMEGAIDLPQGATPTARQQRLRTLTSLVRSVGLVVLSVLALFMVLDAFSVNVGPLLAGAGVVGLAVSFGAQSLVKDVISGLFFLFENQFGVGDVIRVSDVSGAVERMTLRVVVLRDVNGVVHVIPNGEITRVSNVTRSFSQVVIDMGVAYREDVDRVMEVMRDIGRGLEDDPEWGPLLLGEVTVPGIQHFGASSVDVRIMVRTQPQKQWDVARELRLRIKRRFDAEGIEIPFPHQTIYWGDGQKPRLGASSDGRRTDAADETTERAAEVGDGR